VNNREERRFEVLRSLRTAPTPPFLPPEGGVVLPQMRGSGLEHLQLDMKSAKCSVGGRDRIFVPLGMP
jgi:hypothetical protein